jgi:hypothetical protein
MSSSDNAAFAELMALSGLEGFVVPKTDLRVVPMDFKRVGLNLLEGEELHDALTGVRDNVLSYLGSIGSEMDESANVSELMVGSMENRVARGNTAAAFHELMAVEGPGWFGIVKPGQRRLADGLIDHTERLFGVLRGVGYGQYQEVTPEAIKLCQEQHIKPEVMVRPGGYIGLTDAIVCRADPDGFGEVDERYDQVVIPIDVTAFQWSRVYPLE